MRNRQLNSDEVIALQTLNCCSNAVFANIPNLERRMKATGLGRWIGMTKGAAKVLHLVVRHVLLTGSDPDQREMILRRMGSLQLQFGHTRKHPEKLIMLSQEDAETLLAPVLEKCDLDCPCITYDKNGDRVLNTAMVKACETRKALKRAGMSETGLSYECPYHMMTGRDSK